ncbi:riboflavin synthase [Geotoga petraea]|jgi:riboflavin synthase|uniref:Riboflavin synthase n=1 Tax=Geotoga petraea TaxID=28234 RepID=A0A1G6QEI0_9BACT|nr:riboflavin synthase [Geotoga petraea]MDK2945864.1 riboflavin synthase [Geotoga sp.]TGG89306.1 riboflavin synthase [Geotoga petraea]SDC90870.1 riboflavin synthase alpha chain [Geotoga petraea]
MFTGIVEYKTNLNIKGEELNVENKFDDVKVGDSIAINGICLTMKKMEGNKMFFDAGYKTINNTNLKSSRIVNIERAMRLSDRIGGHIVTGHVDGTIRYLGYTRDKNSYKLSFQMPNTDIPTIKNGSITLNGISLTIAEVSLDSFSIQIIDHTWKNTNLSDIKNGDLVNYEVDMFLRYMGGVANVFRNKRGF